ncbi:MAG: DNA methyltransferase [Thermoproteota archaeon]
MTAAAAAERFRFDYVFWLRKVKELGYPAKEVELSVSALAEQGVFPKGLSVKRVVRLYVDDFVELAVVELGDGMTRGVCTRVARSWRRNRLTRPLLLFTDGVDSYVVIVPGPGLEGEAKVLWLHEELYKTDREVIESMRYRGNLEELRKAYDEEFLPYERVRQEFFEGYRSLYQEIVSRTKTILGGEAVSYAQRFLGRLMFLYFLQRKGWLKGDRRFINKIRDYFELNKLFYEALNRKDCEEGIPFLNGSLFEREKYLDKEVEKKLARIMDEVFRKAREFFNRYNFTVDETSPLEVEVSVDPLLLGYVLENMLPEHERGAKGTFYTPVNEIGFMCRRAIAAWLGLEDGVETGADGVMRFVDGLEKYVTDLKRRRDEREIREFRERLLSLKVLDPAVGSGGFLVVMMQTIIQLIQEVEEAVGWRTDVEQYKRRIIPNLYGFDIEGEAVEIARLRIWLSLIVDQKYPMPLPNLDINIVTIQDSLELPKGVQEVLDEYIKEVGFKAYVEEIEAVKARYLNEHDPEEKNALRKRIEELQMDLVRKTGLAVNVRPPVEFYMPSLADIIVMNPPYVRQEKIPKNKKEHYVTTYKLDRTSDIYAYFMVRALRLLKPRGVAALITSDKWLEVGYGITLQKFLKPHVVAVYGQRMRSFEADINTVITIMKKDKLPDSNPIQFIYLERYGDKPVRNYKSIERGKLNPGKWYYLRAPRIFEEVLLPKLTHKLKDFAEIKRGFTTGANEFFYVKDITHLYEADYLANPRKFERWGVNAKTAEELRKQGLIYIENGVRNEEGEKFRFVINEADVKLIIKSPKEITSYKLGKPSFLCIYTSHPGKYTAKYIRWGQNYKHEEEGVQYNGFNEHPTCDSREPWYALPNFKPTRILLPMFFNVRLFFALSDQPVLCDAALYALYPKDIPCERMFLYMNSTLFLLTLELYGMRMGGGALQLKVNFYEMVPTPNLKNLTIDFNVDQLLSREPLPYYEEINQPSRRELDRAVLRALGFGEPELDKLVDELHKAFVEVVEDRLIKAGRPLRGEGEEEGEAVLDDQDS